MQTKDEQLRKPKEISHYLNWLFILALDQFKMVAVAK